MDSRICSVGFPRHFPMPGSIAVAFLVVQQIAEIIMGPGIAWIGGNGTIDAYSGVFAPIVPLLSLAIMDISFQGDQMIESNLSDKGSLFKGKK